MVVSREPQEIPEEIPGFVMEALKYIRRERRELSGNITSLVFEFMILDGYAEAGWWCYDHRSEACQMLIGGAVAKGYRLVSGVCTSYKEVCAYHKARYGAGTMA